MDHSINMSRKPQDPDEMICMICRKLCVTKYLKYTGCRHYEHIECIRESALFRGFCEECQHTPPRTEHEIAESYMYILADEIAEFEDIFDDIGSDEDLDKEDQAWTEDFATVLEWYELLKDGAPPYLLHIEVAKNKRKLPKCLQRLYSIVGG